MSAKKIVVTGATGQQGRETVRALLEQKKWTVVVLTRNVNGAAARALKEMGAVCAESDLLNKPSLVAAFQGAHGVFAMSNPEKNGAWCKDKAFEKAQLDNIIDACAACKVEHVVFSSASKLFDENYPTGMNNYDNKIEAKRRMQQLGFNLTCLGLTGFMSNIEAPWAGSTHYAICALMDGKTWAPWISTEDIGNAVAQCFAMGPAAYGKDICLVSDIQRGDDVAAIVSKIRGYPVKYKSLPALALRIFVPEFYLMKTYFDRNGTVEWEGKYKALYERELAETAALLAGAGRKPITFEQWLRLHKYETKELPKPTSPLVVAVSVAAIAAVASGAVRVLRQSSRR